MTENVKPNMQGQLYSLTQFLLLAEASALIWIRLGPADITQNAASLCIVTLIVSTLTALWRWPQQHRKIVTIVLLSLTAIIAVKLFRNPPNYPRENLWLITLPFYATLLGGFRSAITFTTLAIIVEALCGWALPPRSAAHWHYFTNLILDTLVMAALSMVAWRALQYVIRGVQKLQIELQSDAAKRRTLIETFFDQISPRIDRLQSLLKETQPELLSESPQADQIVELLSDINEILRAARAKLPASLTQSSTNQRTLNEISDLRNRTIQGFFIILELLFIVIAARQVFSDFSLFGPSIVILLGLTITLLLQRRQPKKSKIFARISEGIVAIGINYSALYWKMPWFGPGGTHFAPLILFALIVDGIVGCSIAFVITLSLFVFYAADKSHLPISVPATSSLTLLIVCVFLNSVLLSQLARNKLAQLNVNHRKLIRSLNLRRRLIAVLFHDFGNPLAALNLSLSLATRKRDRISVEKMMHLAVRMREILDYVKTFAMTEDAIPVNQLRNVTVSEIVEPLHEIFADRLSQKRQVMILAGDPNVRLLAIPSVLRNSILGNLVSNAIKFSPKGATVEISVERTDEIHLTVRDRGPGFTNELLTMISEWQEPVPRPGIEGEVGKGLGLLICREFVQRMGGHFELRNRAGGGAEVAIHLKAG